MTDDVMLNRPGVGPAFLPESFRGESWVVRRADQQGGAVDTDAHVASVPPPLSESLQQFRMHLAAKVKYSHGHEPARYDRTGVVEHSLEEMRLDALLWAHHETAQYARLDEVDWRTAPVAQNDKDAARLLIETWFQQAHLEQINPEYTQRQSSAQAKLGEERWNQIKFAADELLERLANGEDGLDWRAEWGERLADLVDPLPPPPPPPAPMVPNSVSPQRIQQIKDQQQQAPAPQPKTPPRRKVLKKIEKPEAPKDDQQPTPEPPPTQGNAPGNQSAGSPSTAPEAQSAGAEEALEGVSPASSAPEAPASQEADLEEQPAADQEDLDAEGSEPESEDSEDGEAAEGDAEQDSDQEPDDLEDEESEGDSGSDSEEDSEDFASEYEEVDDGAPQEDPSLSPELQEIASKEGLAIFDPSAGFQSGGKGNGAMIGKMVIHDHLNGHQRVHSVRQPGGARDRGQIPTNMHRYAIDKSIFTSRRRGGTIVIDGSGSMNWDPDKLDQVLRQIPAATVAIYHGSTTDWVKASGFGIERTDRKNDFRRLQFLPAEIQQAEVQRVNELNAKSGEHNLEVLARETGGKYYMPENAAINGTLCIIGRDGKWGPMGHNRGGSNQVDVEALQWLALQKAPRIWITDGEVHSGYYVEKYQYLSKGSILPWTNKRERDGTDIVRMLCNELKKRHKIQEVKTVKEALKILGVKITSLQELGV